MTSSAVVSTVGSSIIYTCSSDLYPIRIEWYRNNVLLSQTYSTSGTATLGLISTDDEGAMYTCSSIGYHGSQERNKTLSVKGVMLYYDYYNAHNCACVLRFDFVIHYMLY